MHLQRTTHPCCAIRRKTIQFHVYFISARINASYIPDVYLQVTSVLNNIHHYSKHTILTNNVEMAPFGWIKGNWYHNTEFKCNIFFYYCPKL